MAAQAGGAVEAEAVDAQMVGLLWTILAAWTKEPSPWREVEPLHEINGELKAVLASVDALRAAWEDALGQVGPEEFAEGRRRSLRRHAIETGIIERLYDLDWGVTEALVAEGLTAEVAAREGGIDDDTLSHIRSQFSALEFMAEAARGRSPLTIYFVRQLHEAITRHQVTYEAINHLDQIVQAPLHHGQWKLWPNHVRRADGTIFQYAPPEQVQSQMERLSCTMRARMLIRSSDRLGFIIASSVSILLRMAMGESQGRLRCCFCFRPSMRHLWWIGVIERRTSRR